LPRFAHRAVVPRAYGANVTPDLPLRASTARAWLQGDPRRTVSGALVLLRDSLEFRSGERTLRIPLDAIRGAERHAPFAGAMRVSWRIVRADVDVVWQVDEADSWIAALAPPR
jgi:hypothetical protein